MKYQSVPGRRVGRGASRHGVDAESTPRVAAAEAAESEDGASGHAVGTDGLVGVSGAGRGESTAGGRPEQYGFGGRNDPAVKADQGEHEQSGRIEVRPSHRVASGLGGGSRGGIAPDQSGATQGFEQIPLHGRQIAFRDGRPRNKDQIGGRMHGVLIQSEGFTEKAPGAAANDGISDAAGGDDPEST